MIPKVLISGYNDSDMFPPSTLIPLFSNGTMDKDTLQKRASMFLDIIPTFKRKPGYQYIHLISVADGCTYGCNSRADFYNGEACEIHIPHPEKGSPAVVMLDGGISKYHDTFLKSGGVYTEHRNKHSVNPPKSQGYIVAAGYNKPMKRGELIIGVNDDAWHDDLERLANGTPMKFSIGFDASHDRCFPAGTLVLTEHGFIPIELVQPADLVMADDGTWHETLTTMERVADDYTSIKVYGLPLPIESTSNHPYEIVPQEQIKSCYGSTGKCNTHPRHTPDANGLCKRCGKSVDLTSKWVEAQNIRVHDYLKTPVDACSKTTTVGTAFAYLAGMYVGDGYMVFSHYGHDRKREETMASAVSYSCSAAAKDEPILQKILELAPKVTGVEARITQESNGKQAYKVEVFNSLFAHRLLSLFGHGTYHKTIDKSVFGWSAEEKAAFIAGYIDSDGYVGTTVKKSITIVSVNRALMLGVQRLAWSIGIPVTVGRHSSAKFIEKFQCWGKEAFHVTFSNVPTALAKESVKIKDITKAEFETKADGPTVLIHNGYAYMRVTACNSWVGDPRKVYNIEVANRHTYIAEGVSVHNCSICGHVAHTEDEHCDHIKHKPGQWDEDGNAIYMISDRGVYHDISRVRVPAERIAFSIRKVASGVSLPDLEEPSVNPLALPYMLKSASALKRYNSVRKLAAIEKKITAFADPKKQKLLIGGFSKRANDRPIDELHKFIDFALTSEVLGGLQNKRCVLTPEEFLRLFVPESATPQNVEILQGGLPGIFGDIWDSADFDEFCDETDYAGTPCVDLRIIRPIEEVADAACISPEMCMHRELDLQKPTNITIICVKKADNALSREYASYLTDAVADFDDQECMLALLRALTQQGK